MNAVVPEVAEEPLERCERHEDATNSYFMLNYCDGEWMAYAWYGTSDSQIAQWGGDSWEDIPIDSAHPVTNLPCYSRRFLNDLGVPAAAQQEVFASAASDDF